MKKSNKAKQLSIFAFVIFFTFSCSKNNELLQTEFLSNDYFVELSAIKEIASGIHFPIEGSSSLKSTKEYQTKSISSIEEIKNSAGMTLFYIVNYDEGGVVLISSDKRTQPILGFSVNGNFEVDENSYPPGLLYWMNDAKEQIEAIQLSNIEPSPKEEIAWDLVQQAIISEVSALKKEPVPGCYEHTEIITVGPIATPKWTQEGDFNDKLPSITCNGQLYNVPVGCLPLAMAMIMRTHMYPTNYNWSLMPFDCDATITTANFIADIHDAIRAENSNQPIYECYRTGVTMSVAVDVLKDQFDYSCASKADYNFNTVKNNISSGRPVILGGCDANTGHAWVCDGWRENHYYFDDCSLVSYGYLHMNWGWCDEYLGWYASDNFNPGNHSYNEDKDMIYNIIP